MKGRASSINVAGFEYLPQGQLLTQFVDFRHPMGAAYERCVAYSKDFHTHDRINLTFPRSASVIKFSTKKPDQIFEVDDTRFLWMPKDVVHRQDTTSTIYDNLAIFPADSVVVKAFKNFKKRYKLIPRTPDLTIMRRRTPILDALVGEYFTERVLERKKAAVLEGLTYQILDEMLRILFCPKRAQVDREATTSDSPVSRAIRFIEANLFSSIDSVAIAGISHMSVPTLFRKFKTEMGMTPRDYILRRRMDEALTLLKRGDHKVTDVALLVGYEDIAAFSKAFKAHFKKSPSEFLD